MACVVTAAGSAQAFSAGISGSSGKTPGKTCAGCHTGGPPPTSATIKGPAMLAAGAPATFTLEVVTGNDAAQVGFDIAASAGALATAGGAVETQVQSGEITHTKNLGSGGTVSVQFSLTPDAPNTTVTLYAAALRHDPTNRIEQDGTLTTTLDVTVGDVADLFGVAPADMAVAAPANEPRWSCAFAAGARGGAQSGDGAALLLLVLAIAATAAGSSARTVRRRAR